MLSKIISRALERLYAYDSVRTTKEYVRPLKHLIFGKSDIYLVSDLITQARDAAHPVLFVLDVGAAYGDKTLTFLKSFPESAVHCFEPQRLSRARLVKRIAPWRDRVSCTSTACSTRTALSSFASIRTRRELRPSRARVHAARGEGGSGSGDRHAQAAR
jgi:hypothetical protein